MDRPFSIPVLDNLEEAFQNGSDAEFLDAVEEFVKVSKRLPKGGLMGHKYIERLLNITQHRQFVFDVLNGKQP